jgi:ornithine lipid ester-linked acyl 2-hydroxylase
MGARTQKLAGLATVALFVLLIPVQMLMRRFSRVGDSPFFDKALFDWTGAIEADWRAVRAELDQVLRYTEAIPNFQDISEENRALTDDDRWKTFFFRAWGIAIESNCARCPRTAALLERIPGMTSAFYSILLPRKHLPAHRGPYAGVLRYHLGLVVPDPAACRIRVGGQIGHWQEGASLIFDDTYEHEVWNDTDQVRVVLFVDIERPLPWPLAQVNALVIRAIARSSLVRPGLEKFQAWDERLRRAWR